MYNKQHLVSLLSYIGIGFISGAISHGFFSGTRSLIMAILGVLLFIFAEYLQGGQKDYTHLIFGGLIFSISVGMVSGGFQHLLDSPMRSLRIIPVGWLLSTAILPYRESLDHYNFTKSVGIGLLISVILFIVVWGLIWILPSEWFMQGHH